ncbi:MAG: plastocyanin/azurin family copper-binding protein [Actinomycetota bacterium]|nr:plastocyanin/azurin family copper-binding protein [Actinomycetota bacterium]
MMRRITAVCLCLCLAASGGLAVAGCGSDSKKSKSGKSKKKSSKKHAAGATTVIMEGTAFKPSHLSVKAGDTVTWTNTDALGHDVTAEDGSFKSGEPAGMTEDMTFEHVFAKAGSFAYKCTVHSNMTGTVEVTQ